MQREKANAVKVRDDRIASQENILTDEEAVAKPTTTGKMTKIDGASGMPVQDVATPKIDRSSPASVPVITPNTPSTVEMVAGPQFPDSTNADSDLTRPATRQTQKVTK